MKKKIKKKEKEMYQHMNKVGFNVGAAQTKKIVDVKSNNHYGILLTTQKQIEDFQQKSGMRKRYTNEYQYHYWALIARIQLENDILDIAIPTAVFNYKQNISGAAVEFHLKDVEEASELAKSIALEKANEIIASEFGIKLFEMLPIIEWINTPLNTCHVHPGNLTTFSGTDYAKTINDPGVCFPLDEPTNQASFSSILCHGANDIAKMVRTEYRFANFEDGNNTYHHGKCLQYVRGYNYELHEEFSPIQSMFFGTKKITKFECADYHMKDGFDDNLENSFVEKIVELFKASDYEPDTTLVLEDNLSTKAVKTNTVAVHQTYGNYYSKPAYQPTLLEHSTSDIDDIIEEMRDVLMENGYQRAQVIGWSFDTLLKFYERIREEEEEKKIGVTTTTTTSVIEWKESREARDFACKFIGMTDMLIDDMTEEEFEELLEKYNF